MGRLIEEELRRLSSAGPDSGATPTASGGGPPSIADVFQMQQSPDLEGPAPQEAPESAESRAERNREAMRMRESGERQKRIADIAGRIYDRKSRVEQSVERTGKDSDNLMEHYRKAIRSTPTIRDVQNPRVTEVTWDEMLAQKKAKPGTKIVAVGGGFQGAQLQDSYGNTLAQLAPEEEAEAGDIDEGMTVGMYFSGALDPLWKGVAQTARGVYDPSQPEGQRAFNPKGGWQRAETGMPGVKVPAPAMRSGEGINRYMRDLGGAYAEADPARALKESNLVSRALAPFAEAVAAKNVADQVISGPPARANMEGGGFVPGEEPAARPEFPGGSGFSPLTASDATAAAEAPRVQSAGVDEDAAEAQRWREIQSSLTRGVEAPGQVSAGPMVKGRDGREFQTFTPEDAARINRETQVEHAQQAMVPVSTLVSEAVKAKAPTGTELLVSKTAPALVRGAAEGVRAVAREGYKSSPDGSTIADLFSHDRPEIGILPTGPRQAIRAAGAAAEAAPDITRITTAEDIAARARAHPALQGLSKAELDAAGLEAMRVQHDPALQMQASPAAQALLEAQAPTQYRLTREGLPDFTPNPFHPYRGQDPSLAHRSGATRDAAELPQQSYTPAPTRGADDADEALDARVAAEEPREVRVPPRTIEDVFAPAPPRERPAPPPARADDADEAWDARVAAEAPREVRVAQEQMPVAPARQPPSAPTPVRADDADEAMDARVDAEKKRKRRAPAEPVPPAPPEVRIARDPLPVAPARPVPAPPSQVRGADDADEAWDARVAAEAPREVRVAQEQMPVGAARQAPPPSPTPTRGADDADEALDARVAAEPPRTIESTLTPEEFAARLARSEPRPAPPGPMDVSQTPSMRGLAREGIGPWNVAPSPGRSVEQDAAARMTNMRKSNESTYDIERFAKEQQGLGIVEGTALSAQKMLGAQRSDEAFHRWLPEYLSEVQKWKPRNSGTVAEYAQKNGLPPIDEQVAVAVRRYDGSARAGETQLPEALTEVLQKNDDVIIRTAPKGTDLKDFKDVLSTNGPRVVWINVPDEASAKLLDGQVMPRVAAMAWKMAREPTTKAKAARQLADGFNNFFGGRQITYAMTVGRPGFQLKNLTNMSMRMLARSDDAMDTAPLLHQVLNTPPGKAGPVIPELGVSAGEAHRMLLEQSGIGRGFMGSMVREHENLPGWKAMERGAGANAGSINEVFEATTAPGRQFNTATDEFFKAAFTPQAKRVGEMGTSGLPAHYTGEDVLRANLMLHLWRKGMKPAEAAAEMKGALIDFSTMSPATRVLSIAAPFANYYVGATEGAFDLALRNPKMFRNLNMIAKANQAMDKAGRGPLNEKFRTAEEAFSGQALVQDESGAYHMVGPDTPGKETADLFGMGKSIVNKVRSDTLGDPGERDITAVLHPVFSQIYGFSTGKELSTGRSIAGLVGGDSTAGQFKSVKQNAAMGGTLPGQLQYMLDNPNSSGLQLNRPLGAHPELAASYLMLANNPFTSRYFTAPEHMLIRQLLGIGGNPAANAEETARDQRTRALNRYFTGLSNQPVDLQARALKLWLAHEKTLAESSDAVEEGMHEQGRVRPPE